MESDVEIYAQELADDGIVVIEDFLEAEVCDELFERLSETIENGDIDVVGKGEDYNYGEFVNWGGPVANKRSGRDEGMIDVFHIDKVINDVKDIKNNEIVNDIINRATSRPYSPDNINVYWNKSVTETRGFHADTYSGKFKSFVYLTDVTNRSYGPFSYIEGSHRISKPKRMASKAVNKLKGTKLTDAVFYDESDVNYCTAPKGTLIIANQAGYHRGHPQSEGKERMLVTTSYTPAQ